MNQVQKKAEAKRAVKEAEEKSNEIKRKQKEHEQNPCCNDGGPSLFND